MAAENRLTSEQLASLAPGDPVTIESGQDFGRRRHTSGTVVRRDGARVVVRCGAYLEHYSLRDGVREGGVGRAELVNLDREAATSEERRRTGQIDLLYRDWARDRRDLSKLQQLHSAITLCLGQASQDASAGAP